MPETEISRWAKRYAECFNAKAGIKRSSSPGSITRPVPMSLKSSAAVTARNSAQYWMVSFECCPVLVRSYQNAVQPTTSRSSTSFSRWMFRSMAWRLIVSGRSLSLNSRQTFARTRPGHDLVGSFALRGCRCRLSRL